MQSLKKLLEAGSPEKIAQFMKEYNLCLKDGKIVPRDEDTKQQYKEKETFYNGRQQARKILLEH